MKGDATSMEVLLVNDTSTGYLGATDLDRKVVPSVLLRYGGLNGWSPLAMRACSCKAALNKRFDTC